MDPQPSEMTWTKGDLAAFVRESNRIENIHEVRRSELQAHEDFFKLELVTSLDLERFVDLVAPGNVLRIRHGLNVTIGGHLPPSGGPAVGYTLDDLLAHIDAYTPYGLHVQYELLHPFTDGNGRSGRALWAWHMMHLGLWPFTLPFLHRFYYQALNAARR